jgi:hypothetical protein
MAENVMVVFVVEMTEYERGWGSRPDGNLAFVSEDAAKKYVQKQTADRTGPAPDEYVAYDLVGYRECTPAFFQKLKDNSRGFQYFDRLGELKA